MLLNLLENEGADTVNNSMYMWIWIGVLLLLLVVYFFFSSRRRKKQEQQFEEVMSSLKEGDKILTIGRWYGEIVEILEDGKFVVKTGSDAHCGYVTIDKNTIAHVFKDEQPAAEPFEETEAPAKEPAAEETEASAEEKTEAPAEEKAE